MKSWAQAPSLTLQTLHRLGGQVRFNSSGSISVKPKDNTWLGKGVLSWIADAVRNHGAAAVTRRLTGVDIYMPRQTLPEVASSNLNLSTRYAFVLAHDYTLDPQLLAGLRRETATRHKIRLALDTIKQIDDLIERDLHNWTSAPFLVQQHRWIISRAQAFTPVAIGLETEHSRYQSAISAVEEEARKSQATSASRVRDLVRTAVDYFGSSGWQDGLEPDLTELFEKARWMPGKAFFRHLEGKTIELPNGDGIASSLLAALAQRALKGTAMAKSLNNTRGAEQIR
jgi:hypothetical protein